MACAQEAAPGRAGLYIDLENLQGDSHRMVQDLIDNWTDKAPILSRLNLYIWANQMELWRIWATSKFANLDVKTNGTQHFNKSPTKNSADIAISVHAMADLTLHRISHAVVFSDDSDFISLYTAIRDEPAIPKPEGRVPFTWVVTDREGSLSTMVKQFFPQDQLHVVSTKGTKQAKPSMQNQESQPSPHTQSLNPAMKTEDPYSQIAKLVVETTQIGTFKSADCQDAIKTNCPTHQLAKASTSHFGNEFKNNVWPILEQWGVRISNPGKRPVRYEMTAEAKTRYSQAPLVQRPQGNTNPKRR